MHLPAQGAGHGLANGLNGRPDAISGLGVRVRSNGTDLVLLGLPREIVLLALAFYVEGVQGQVVASVPIAWGGDPMYVLFLFEGYILFTKYFV